MIMSMISDVEKGLAQLLLNEMQLSRVSGMVNSSKVSIIGSIKWINKILDENPENIAFQELIEILVLLNEAKEFINVTEERLLEIQGCLADMYVNRRDSVV